MKTMSVMITLFLGAACMSAPPLSLESRELLLTGWTAGGQAVALVPGTQVRLSFADGSLNAHAGCNHIGGSYAISDGRLQAASLAMTEIGCSQELHQQDERLVALLSSNPTVRLDGGQLVLDGPSGTAVFADREVLEPDLPLVGPTWSLTTLIDGDAARSVPVDVRALIEFADDGTFTVEPGCNSGGGSYELGDGVVVLGPIALTRMACPGDRDHVERAVLAVLHGEVEFEIRSGTLTLSSGDLGLQLTGR
ncbi:MAG TPA: META domain-containing protein [Candidatus Limnocylindrales bacterium]|nr:META domain-containing protein [Candidatus Limnocylindrales bacterium]